MTAPSLGVEVLKLRSVPTTWFLVALAFVAVVLPASLVMAFTEVESAEHVLAVLSLAGSGGLPVLLLGGVAAAGEYRHRTVVPMALSSPRRLDALGAQVAAHTLLGAAVGLAACLVTSALVFTWLAVPGSAAATPSPGAVMASFVGAVAYTALSGALGVGLGALARNQVAAVIALLLYVTMGAYLLTLAAPALSKFDPIAVGIAMSGGTEGIAGPSSPVLAAGPATLVYCGYTAVLVGLAGVAFRRRELR